MNKATPSAIWLIIVVYLLLAALYATYTPAWQAPDEPAHYNYVRQLAAGDFPIIEVGDYDQAYIGTVVSSRFDPQYSLTPLEYEDWQPPLYYLLQTPIFWLTDGSLPAMRLFSLLLGAGVVALAYGLARRLFPEQKWLAATTAVFVAFLPQHLAILASVNNDSLAELLIAAILFVLLGLLAVDDWEGSNGRRHLQGLGLLLGLGFLTKGTVYLLAPVVGGVLLWRDWQQWRRLVRHGLRVFTPALLLGAIWWGRNAFVYGGLDLMATAAHNGVVVDQPRTAEWIAQYGLSGTLQRFVQTTFHSFWGQFGWMGLPMPGWVYRLLLLFTTAVVLGLLLHGLGKRPLSAASLVLISTFLLTAVLYLGYNLTFVQHQGRYLFPALIPIGVGVAVGLGVWQRPLAQRWPIFYPLLPLGLAVALIGLALLALFAWIAPLLAPPL